ncbi:MAG: cysteine hydrolase [Gammaproteobacteria bacterium]
MTPNDTAYLAIHYQNENCHRDGNIKVGMGRECPWREERLDNARRSIGIARIAGIPIIHVRLAVRPDFADVTVNTPIIAEWVENNAWREGTWGTEFLEGFDPVDGDFVVTHTRNSALYGCDTEAILRALGTQQLIVSGVSTAYAVEGTVRHATDMGFACTVIADACSTATEIQHEGALRAMTPLATIMTVDEFANAVQRNA